MSLLLDPRARHSGTAEMVREPPSAPAGSVGRPPGSRQTIAGTRSGRTRGGCVAKASIGAIAGWRDVTVGAGAVRAADDGGSQRCERHGQAVHVDVVCGTSSRTALLARRSGGGPISRQLGGPRWKANPRAGGELRDGGGPADRSRRRPVPAALGRAPFAANGRCVPPRPSRRSTWRGGARGDGPPGAERWRENARRRLARPPSRAGRSRRRTSRPGRDRTRSRTRLPPCRCPKRRAGCRARSPPPSRSAYRSGGRSRPEAAGSALVELLYGAGLRISRRSGSHRRRWISRNASSAWSGRAARSGSYHSADPPPSRCGATSRSAPASRPAPPPRRVPERPRRHPHASRRVPHPSPPPGREGRARPHPQFTHTCCATRSPPACWRGAPTYGGCRRCSVTPTSAPPRCTRT